MRYIDFRDEKTMPKRGHPIEETGKKVRGTRGDSVRIGKAGAEVVRSEGDKPDRLIRRLQIRLRAHLKITEITTVPPTFSLSPSAPSSSTLLP